MKKLLIVILAAMSLTGCARVYYANCATFGTSCDKLTVNKLEQIKEGRSYSGVVLNNQNTSYSLAQPVQVVSDDVDYSGMSKSKAFTAGFVNGMTGGAVGRQQRIQREKQPQQINVNMTVHHW